MKGCFKRFFIKFTTAFLAFLTISTLPHSVDLGAYVIIDENIKKSEPIHSSYLYSFEIFELERMMLDVTRSSNHEQVNWSAAVFKSCGNLIASIGNDNNFHDSNMSIFEFAKSFTVFTSSENILKEAFEKSSMKSSFNWAFNTRFRLRNSLNRVVPESRGTDFAGLFVTSSYKKTLYDYNHRITFVGFAPYYNPKYIILINAENRSHKAYGQIEKSDIFQLFSCIFGFLHDRNVNLDFFIPVHEINKLLNLESGFIYFGRPTCPFCDRFTPELVQLANYTQSIVFYFDTDRWRMNESFHDVLEKFNVRSVPYLIEISDGEFEIIFGVGVSDWQSDFINRARRTY
ncbi:MAG: thioredoxin family protein [Oscillospiraceae bacterium]|nr:thioredoxin family protein [Oscillospiraceae bacterium]